MGEKKEYKAKGAMMRWFLCTTITTLILVCAPVGKARAQGMMAVDMNSTGTRVFGGGLWGGDVRAGLVASAYHPYVLTAPRPDFDTYALLAIAPATHRLLLQVGVGAGVSENSGLTWSVRSLAVVTHFAPVAARGMVLMVWTPSEGRVLLQGRLGITIRLGARGSVTPYLAIVAPDIKNPGDLFISPGWTFTISIG